MIAYLRIQNSRIPDIYNNWSIVIGAIHHQTVFSLRLNDAMAISLRLSLCAVQEGSAHGFKRSFPLPDIDIALFA